MYILWLKTHTFAPPPQEFLPRSDRLLLLLHTSSQIFFLGILLGNGQLYDTYICISECYINYILLKFC